MPVLTAVDYFGMMLIDAAKGLEQTLKLFQVCKHRRIPIITVINQVGPAWPSRAGADGRDPGADGALPYAFDVAVGIAENHTRCSTAAEISSGSTRTAGGATAAPEEHIAAADVRAAPAD